MGIDYTEYSYVGFQIDRNWNDEIAELIRNSIQKGVLEVVKYNYLAFTRLTRLLFIDRVSHCMVIDRITGESSYPQEYFKILKPPTTPPSITDEELDILQITGSELIYFKEASIG